LIGGRLWSDLTLRGKATVVLGVVALGLLSLGCAAYRIEVQATAAEQSVSSAFQALYQIQRLETSETDASAQIRGYLMTRDEAFATRVREAVAAFDDVRHTLGTLTAGRPELSQLAGLESSRVERIYSTMARLRSNAIASEELRAAVLQAEQERLVIESLIKRMLRERSLLLQSSLAGRDRLRSHWRGAVWICLLVAIAAGGGIWSLFDRGCASRIERLKGDLAGLEAAGLIDSLPENRDAIQALAEGMSKVAAILYQRTRVLDRALHGIASIDVAGRYLSFNNAYAELAGVSKHNPSLCLLASVHGDDWENVEEAIQDSRQAGRKDTTARMVRPDGSMSEVAMTFLRVGTQPDGGHYLFVRDITLQNQTEAELIRAKDAAVASNIAKTGFLAKISHDIRTPLNAILGASNLLSETALSTDQAEYVSMFQRNCRRLVALINDFLDFSKIEAGAVRVERLPFRARQTVDDVLGTFRDSASRKGLALDVHFEPSVPEWQMGDALRVQQVLVNLVSNAVKFTSEGRVHVEVLVSENESGRRLRFEVSDTGAGIRAMDRERIFAPFTQLPDQTAGGNLGTGLGLTICRELVQLMDGEIGLSCAESPGSTFYFNVPLVEVESGVEVLTQVTLMPGFPLVTPSESVRILVAEDTEDNRVLLEHYLKNEPVALRFAKNGYEALEALQNGEQFDLILMDIDMPRLDGRAATQRIHEWEAQTGASATPIVALSAHAILPEVRASLDAGCIAHVAKPVDQPTLIGTIRRYARTAKRSENSAASEAIATLAPKYLASKAKQIEDACVYLAAQEFDPIQRFGHNLKGTGRGYGFPELEELGRAIEAAAVERDEKSIAAQLLELHRLVSEAAVALSQG
jgi:PAS domain S-box-containing protein